MGMGLLRKSSLAVIMIVAILAVLVGGVYLWDFILGPKTPSVQSNKFVGKIERVEGENIYARGTYQVDKSLYAQAPPRETETLVAIKVDSRTQLNKTTQYLPGVPNPVPGVVYRYSSKDIRTENSQGDKGDFNNLPDPIVVTAQEDVYGRNSFTASSIDYVIVVYPKSQ